MTTTHPAKFSDPILDVIADLLPEVGTVLDPFAGTGRIHELATPTILTVGVEIEPEWADLHPDTICGDATALPFNDATFDAVVTSPTYGNRMADHYNIQDTSKRNTYQSHLGRDLHPNNTGRMKWGQKYRNMNEQAWTEVHRVLKPGGRFILNISDHIKRGEQVMVTDWHDATITALGFIRVEKIPVRTPRLGFGANGKTRVGNEWVILYEKR